MIAGIATDIGICDYESMQGSPECSPGRVDLVALRDKFHPPDKETCLQHIENLDNFMWNITVNPWMLLNRINRLRQKMALEGGAEFERRLSGAKETRAEHAQRPPKPQLPALLQPGPRPEGDEAFSTEVRGFDEAAGKPLVSKTASLPYGRRRLTSGAL